MEKCEILDLAKAVALCERHGLIVTVGYAADKEPHREQSVAVTPIRRRGRKPKHVAAAPVTEEGKATAPVMPGFLTKRRGRPRKDAAAVNGAPVAAA